MALVAELFPTGEDHALLVGRLARLQREINNSSDDVIKQARLLYRMGRLRAEYGHHEAAVDDFKDARERYGFGGTDGKGNYVYEKELTLVEIRLGRSQRILEDMESNPEAMPKPSRSSEASS